MISTDANKLDSFLSADEQHLRADLDSIQSENSFQDHMADERTRARKSFSYIMNNIFLTSRVIINTVDRDSEKKESSDRVDSHECENKYFISTDFHYCRLKIERVPKHFFGYCECTFFSTDQFRAIVVGRCCFIDKKKKS